MMKSLMKINFTLYHNVLKLAYSDVEFQKNFPEVTPQIPVRGRRRVEGVGWREGKWRRKENWDCLSTTFSLKVALGTSFGLEQDLILSITVLFSVAFNSCTITSTGHWISIADCFMLTGSLLKTVLC